MHIVFSWFEWNEFFPSCIQYKIWIVKWKTWIYNIKEQRKKNWIVISFILFLIFSLLFSSLLLPPSSFSSYPFILVPFLYFPFIIYNFICKNHVATLYFRSTGIKLFTGNSWWLSCRTVDTHLFMHLRCSDKEVLF